jgi:hypothetical protein
MEVYEQRVGTLQALEVSLLGMQVGYAGYFASVIVHTPGFCKVTGITLPLVSDAQTARRNELAARRESLEEDTSPPSGRGSKTEAKRDEPPRGS